MLHILRHSPHSDSRLSDCLRAISPEHGLLLIEDAVYSLLPDTASRNALDQLAESINLYAIESHLFARGLTLDALPKRVKTIDYSSMVGLCLNHTKMISW